MLFEEAHNGFYHSKPLHDAYHVVQGPLHCAIFGTFFPYFVLDICTELKEAIVEAHLFDP